MFIGVERVDDRLNRGRDLERARSSLAAALVLFWLDLDFVSVVDPGGSVTSESEVDRNQLVAHQSLGRLSRSSGLDGYVVERVSEWKSPLEENGPCDASSPSPLDRHDIFFSLVLSGLELGKTNRIIPLSPPANLVARCLCHCPVVKALGFPCFYGFNDIIAGQ